MNKRAYQRTLSNNPCNPNKNICTTEVCRYLGVEDSIPYLQTTDDVIRAARTEFTVRSRASNFRNKSIGQGRAKMATMAEEFEFHVYGFIVFVTGHVLFINRFGKTIVDTDSRKSDRRKIQKIYIVY